MKVGIGLIDVWGNIESCLPLPDLILRKAHDEYLARLFTCFFLQ
jgi:hypothetical protein